nr:MAG TPA: hypothetical protein [Caudoviricetes sp.]
MNSCGQVGSLLYIRRNRHSSNMGAIWYMKRCQ